MRLVVLDTNALIQALPSRSQYHQIWTDFLAGKYRMYDDKFVDCAITAGADYIVTEDSHFDHLKNIPFPRLNILTLDEFNETLKQ